MPATDIVKRLRAASNTPLEQRDEQQLQELLREAAEVIEGMQRQQMDGEVFLDFSSKAPRQGG